MGEELFYKKITRSLDNLEETHSSSSELRQEDSFGAKIIEKKQPSPEFFIWRTFHIHNKGKWEDLEVSNYKFSKIAKSELYSHFYKGSYRNISLTGLTPNGEEFKFCQRAIPELSDLVNIVLAIIVISESKSIEDAIAMWQIFSGESSISEANICLNDILRLNNFTTKCLPKYQFMKKLIDSSMQVRIEQIKKELDKNEQ